MAWRKINNNSRKRKRYGGYLLCKWEDFLSIFIHYPKYFPIHIQIFFFTYPKTKSLILVRAQNANDRLSLFIFIYKILLKYNSNRSSCHAILNTYNIGWWFNQMYYLWYHIYVCYSYLPLTPFLIIFYLWDICVK